MVLWSRSHRYPLCAVQYLFTYWRVEGFMIDQHKWGSSNRSYRKHFPSWYNCHGSHQLNMSPTSVSAPNPHTPISQQVNYNRQRELYKGQQLWEVSGRFSSWLFCLIRCQGGREWLYSVCYLEACSKTSSPRPSSLPSKDYINRVSKEKNNEQRNIFKELVPWIEERCWSLDWKYLESFIE